ncbi:hypothetical protein Aple_082000 [Acrocarpospora pleiomorpha]|uniref:Glycosyl hydrolase n=1 Tax=Acrocarpospora pleiomorpha TaxID=90975 RepID=A0A5M3Y0G8_9ACTN|nr:hypothetical protein Aple_082000 [Acrocarpospora pleiomorpha]
MTALAACFIALGCAAQPKLADPAPSPSSAPTTSAPSLATTPAATFSKRWVQVPGLPDDDAWERGMRDVSAAGPEVAWAVGYTGWEDSVRTSLRTWDGLRWRAVPVQNALGSLGSIDSDGPRNAWMLGGGFEESFAQHWDGRAWRQYRLDAFGRDVAVDGRRVVVISDTAVLTWNGTAFVTERVLGGKETRLVAVDTGAGHTWVAGIRAEQPVIWHGHDGRYEETTLPGGSIDAILQIGPDDVWAVGSAGVLHWDGRSWQRPAIPLWNGELESVTAFGPDDVWFAGKDRDEPGGVSVLHWDGRSWTKEVPQPGGEGHHAQIERIPGTSQLWLMVNVENGDSESIVTFRRE